MTLTDYDYIQTAFIIYVDDNIQIDEDTKLSHTDEGAWVQAWLWVSNNQVKRYAENDD